VNPGDLRVASLSCGTVGCHGSDAEDHVRRTQRSMMAHGAMLWEAALYNNGSYPEKTARFGEAYDVHGAPARLHSCRRRPRRPGEPAPKQPKGGRPSFLDPLPRFEIGQPSNILRVFERGQRKPLAIGNPVAGIPGLGLDEEPGRPANRLSDRGLGTLNRTDPVWLNLQRTRLLDPTLNMLGTNDHPGDYRSSGCTACHVVYANDRDPLNARRGGNPRGEPLGPVGPRPATAAGRSSPTRPSRGTSRATRSSTSSPARSRRAQCIVCHMHPGTAVSNTYLGYTWWDLETDGQAMWPKDAVRPDPGRGGALLRAQPRGLDAQGAVARSASSWRRPARTSSTPS
jgi:hypothetical protein